MKLFETTDSGVIVRTDELLEYSISRAAMNSGATSEKEKVKVKNAAIKQAKYYLRAIGRIILHFMANEYILPAKAIHPFFMTGE